MSLALKSGGGSRGGPSSSGGAGASSSAATLSADLASLFECPVCFDYVLPPILQCQSGHLVCSQCRPKLTCCPTCRGPLGNIRNLAMEKVASTVTFPCRYQTTGCQAALLHSEKGDHEEGCEFRPYGCPCPGASCKWQGALDAVMPHLVTSHKSITTLQGEDIVFLATDIGLPGAVDWVMMQSCFGHHFMLVLEKQMASRSGTSCRHVNTSGYRCSRPSLQAHRGYCRQHASQLHLPPPVRAPSQPSRRGGRGGGAGRQAASAPPPPPAPAPAPPPAHATPDIGARRRGPSAGRIPTVEQLLGRIDRLRTTSPSAESAWSEESDHETPTLGSSRQYAGSGCTGDSSDAESSAEGPEAVDLLQHAGTYTAEEAALLARDKLVRQQALYIEQFSRLQHLLREGRRRYLHEVKLERQARAEASKERQRVAEAGGDHSERSSRAADGAPGRSGARIAPQRSRHDAEERLRAAWRYHRHRGICAILRRKAWDRRAETTPPPGPRCVHTEGGVRCSERCLPASKFCLKHILNDPHQMLYVPCVGRRNLTLKQRDEEFHKGRRKARRTTTGSRAASATNTARQPPPKRSRMSARACARGTNPAVAAVLAARGRAGGGSRSRPRASAPAPATGRKRTVVGVVAPIPRNRDAAKAVATEAATARSATARSATARSATARPAAARSAARTATTRPATARPATARPANARPATARPATTRANARPGTDKPVAAKTVTARPVAVQAEVAQSSKRTAGVAASTAGRARSLKSVNLQALQRELNSKMAADITVAVRNKDAAAFAAALGVEKTPSIEKLVRRRAVARIVDAMERRDAAAVMAARMSARKSRKSSQKVVKTKVVRRYSAREVIKKARKIAALAAVLQTEEARRLVAALKSRDPTAVFAALKSKDAAAVEAALRAKDATALAAALRPAARPAESANPSNAATGATVGAPSARPVGPTNVPGPAAPVTSGVTPKVPTASRFKDAVALMASLKPADKVAVMAALRAKDTEALKAVLKSESVAPIIANLKAKGLLVPAKSAKSSAPTTAVPKVPPVTTTTVRPSSVASAVRAVVTRRSGGVAAKTSVVRSTDARATAPVKSAALPVIPKSEKVTTSMAVLKSENVTTPMAAPKSEIVTTSTAAPKSEIVTTSTSAPKSENASTSMGTPKSTPLAPPVSRATAISPKTKAIQSRGLALEVKVPAAVRGKSAAAKAAAAKLKAATTTLAKAKKRVRCQEPVLCVFEADMRCPWHVMYVPDERYTAQAGAVVPKVEVKAPKEEPDEDHGAECFGPLNKKIKMELDEPTPDIGCIVGDVEMKTEPIDEAADEIASVTGSANQADLSTESTLSATSPRAVDEVDDDCRDLDMEMDTGAEEVMLQPPLGEDDADLVAVAQGVAVVGAQEEVAVVQQDDDSLTNPPAAVDEVEVS